MNLRKWTGAINEHIGKRIQVQQNHKII